MSYFGGIFTSTEQRLNADGTSETTVDFYIRLNRNLRDSGMLAQLKGAPLAVLISLMLYSDAEGTAFPSAERLGRDTGYHRNTVIQACRMLEEMGWIERRQLRSEEGTYAHTVYTLKEPKSPPQKETHRDTKNRTRLNRTRLIVHEGLTRVKDYPKEKEESAEKLGDTSNPRSKSDDSEEPAKDSSSFDSVINSINKKIPQKDNPTNHHLEKLGALHDSYGQEALLEIIEFAFDEFFPGHTWMRGRPLTWGTVMHLLGDAAAAWSELEPVYRWECPRCGSIEEGKASNFDGRPGLLCYGCYRISDLEKGVIVSRGKAAPKPEEDDYYKPLIPWEVVE